VTEAQACENVSKVVAYSGGPTKSRTRDSSVIKSDALHCVAYVTFLHVTRQQTDEL